MGLDCGGDTQHLVENDGMDSIKRFKKMTCCQQEKCNVAILTDFVKTLGRQPACATSVSLIRGVCVLGVWAVGGEGNTCTNSSCYEQSCEFCLKIAVQGRWSEAGLFGVEGTRDKIQFFSVTLYSSHKVQTHKMFKRTLFIRTKYNMQIFEVIAFIKLQNDT